MAKRLLITLSLLLVLVSPLSVGATSFDQPKALSRIDIDAPAIPGEFIIKFRNGTRASERSAIVQTLNGHIQKRIMALDLDVVEFPILKRTSSPRRVELLLTTLKYNPKVEFVEPNYIYAADYTPNDPELNDQYAWNAIEAYTAWDTTRGSSDVVIAVVDSGVQLNHPDLDDKLVAGFDFVQNDATPSDGNGHGTHVAGTAAAETNNNTGGAGVCPNCRLLPVRVLNDTGSGTLSDLASGIAYAANNGAKIINLSLGGSRSFTLAYAVDYAWERGAFLTCAAGNSSTSNAYPAADPNCFAVAATTSSDRRSSFSSYGSWVDIAAPGSDIYSTWLNNGYNAISGTSMATSHVAGLAGLLASQGLSNAEIRDRLCNTADRIRGTGSFWNCGRINAQRAVTNDVNPSPSVDTAMLNGGFEEGFSSWWQSSNGGYQLISANRPQNDLYSAWLGGYNNAADEMYQTITIPSNATLTYSWYISTQESGSRAYDSFSVGLYDTQGALITTLRTLSNASSTGRWQQDTLSLAAYAGQTIRIHFSATTDYTLPTSFYIDDVSVQ
ncbi:MAG: S8 family serine peptidase [Chloroflexales bacterium]|nr:S8 family serine peptidase [Chloroflexales bacterium]